MSTPKILKIKFPTQFTTLNFEISTAVQKKMTKFQFL